MGKGRPPDKPTPMAFVDDVQPMRDLNAEENDIWLRWCAVLRATRQFLSTDGPLLTCVVDMEIRKRRAREALATDGHYQEGRRHPALTDCDNAHRDLMALLRELGLTAASAKNVKATPRSREADQLTEFLNQSETKTEDASHGG